MSYQVQDDELLFAKTRSDAIIPSKEDENAGYDIYPCFDEDYMVIPTNETILIPTGIASAINPKYYIQIEERGSTGSKGMKKSAGVIDSSFRGEWFIAISNVTNNDIVISKVSKEELIKKHNEKRFEQNILQYGEEEWEYIFIDNSTIFYPYTKAIAQAVVHEVPNLVVSEIDYEDLKAIPSKRGTGSLGSTNK